MFLAQFLFICVDDQCNYWFWSKLPKNGNFFTKQSDRNNRGLKKLSLWHVPQKSGQLTLPAHICQICQLRQVWQMSAGDVSCPDFWGTCHKLSFFSPLLGHCGHILFVMLVTLFMLVAVKIIQTSTSFFTRTCFDCKFKSAQLN